MSRIATKPSAACTWSPSATSRQNRQSSGGDGNDALLGDSDGARVQELAHLAVDEPRRVVVAVPAARPIDEDAIGRADLRRPAPARELVGERAQPARFAPSSPPRGTVSAAAVFVPGRGEYGKTWTRVRPGLLDDVERARERALVLAREPDDHVRGEVEVGERLELRARTAPPSSGGPSRGGRRRLPTAAGRGDEATRRPSRAAPRRGRP